VAPYALFAPGELPETTRGGDILLVRSDKLASRFIRLVDGGDFSHVATVVDGTGTIVEATARGVVRRHVSAWEDVLFAVVSPDLSEEDRADVVAHAEWVAGDGWSYDWVTFVGTALFWATGGRLMISGGAKAAICSAQAADNQHAGGERFEEAIPHFHTPRMIQEHYGVDV
jgi:hypothetical protein